jgi:zinc protease
VTIVSPLEPVTLPLMESASVHRYLLPNGLTLLLRRVETAPVVAIVTYVKAGYFDETDDVVGIAHVLEHMFFKGTERRGVGQIAKETKASGGYLNAATIYDHTSYYTVLPSSGFGRGLEIQADAYANSVIDAEELARELEVIIQEAKRKADNPAAVATETLYEVLHDQHRIRRWRIGRERGLRALTRQHLVAFYRNFYRPSNTIVAIAGDIDLDDAQREVERLYGPIPNAPVERNPGPPADSAPGFRFRELSGDIVQTQIGLGWRTPATLHRDTPLLDLAASVLGSGRASRLYRAVRERQLASSVSAYNYTPTELGVFVVHAEAPPETTADAARAMWDQLRALRDEGVGQLELERSRRIFEARWIRRLETAEGQANYLAEWEALGDWMIGERYLERLLTVTAEEVSEAVRRYLDPESAGLVVYRPQAVPEFAQDPRGARDALEKPRPAPLPPTPPRAAAPVRGERHARFDREEAAVRIYRTRGEVPILIRRKAGAALVTIGVFAAGGAVLEPLERAGLTSLMARTALKGTSRRTATQIAEDGELLGGSIGASVGVESFGWTISVPTKHLMAALELLADVAQHATFPEDALETERAIALADLAALRDDMYRYPVRLLLQAAYPGHPYGVPVSGTEETLSRLAVEEIRRWYGARMLEASSVIAIVGDVDPELAADATAREFDALELIPLPEVPSPAWPTAVAQVAERREKAQTALALAFPAPTRTDDDRYAARLLAGVASGLGGRFFDELRDRRSLAYTVQAFSSERRLGGTFLSYIATSPEQEDEARAGLLLEFAKLRERPVEEDELARAKAYAIGTNAIRRESGAAVLGEIVDAWMFGQSLAELEEFEERVNAVNTEDIQRLAQRYFDESRRVEGIVRGVGKTV